MASNLYWFKVVDKTTLFKITENKELIKFLNKNVNDIGLTSKKNNLFVFDDDRSFWISTKNDDVAIELSCYVAKLFNTVVIMYDGNNFFAVNKNGIPFVLTELEKVNYHHLCFKIYNFTGIDFDNDFYKSLKQDNNEYKIQQFTLDKHYKDIISNMNSIMKSDAHNFSIDSHNFYGCDEKMCRCPILENETENDLNYEEFFNLLSFNDLKEQNQNEYENKKPILFKEDKENDAVNYLQNIYTRDFVKNNSEFNYYFHQENKNNNKINNDSFEKELLKDDKFNKIKSHINNIVKNEDNYFINMIKKASTSKDYDPNIFNEAKEALDLYINELDFANNENDKIVNEHSYNLDKNVNLDFKIEDNTLDNIVENIEEEFLNEIHSLINEDKDKYVSLKLNKDHKEKFDDYKLDCLIDEIACPEKITISEQEIEDINIENTYLENNNLEIENKLTSKDIFFLKNIDSETLFEKIDLNTLNLSPQILTDNNILLEFKHIEENESKDSITKEDIEFLKNISSNNLHEKIKYYVPTNINNDVSWVSNISEEETLDFDNEFIMNLSKKANGDNDLDFVQEPDINSVFNDMLEDPNDFYISNDEHPNRIEDIKYDNSLMMDNNMDKDLFTNSIFDKENDENDVQENLGDENQLQEDFLMFTKMEDSTIGNDNLSNSTSDSRSKQEIEDEFIKIYQDLLENDEKICGSESCNGCSDSNSCACSNDANKDEIDILAFSMDDEKYDCEIDECSCEDKLEDDEFEYEHVQNFSPIGFEFDETDSKENENIEMDNDIKNTTIHDIIDSLEKDDETTVENNQINLEQEEWDNLLLSINESLKNAQDLNDSEVFNQNYDEEYREFFSKQVHQDNAAFDYETEDIATSDIQDYNEFNQQYDDSQQYNSFVENYNEEEVYCGENCSCNDDFQEINEEQLEENYYYDNVNSLIEEASESYSCGENCSCDDGCQNEVLDLENEHYLGEEYYIDSDENVGNENYYYDNVNQMIENAEEVYSCGENCSCDDGCQNEVLDLENEHYLGEEYYIDSDENVGNENYYYDNVNQMIENAEEVYSCGGNCGCSNQEGCPCESNNDYEFNYETNVEQEDEIEYLENYEYDPDDFDPRWLQEEAYQTEGYDSEQFDVSQINDEILEANEFDFQEVISESDLFEQDFSEGESNGLFEIEEYVENYDDNSLYQLNLDEEEVDEIGFEKEVEEVLGNVVMEYDSNLNENTSLEDKILNMAKELSVDNNVDLIRQTCPDYLNNETQEEKDFEVSSNEVLNDMLNRIQTNNDQPNSISFEEVEEENNYVYNEDDNQFTWDFSSEETNASFVEENKIASANDNSLNITFDYQVDSEPLTVDIEPTLSFNDDLLDEEEFEFENEFDYENEEIKLSESKLNFEIEAQPSFLEDSIFTDFDDIDEEDEEEEDVVIARNDFISNDISNINLDRFKENAIKQQNIIHDLNKFLLRIEQEKNLMREKKEAILLKAEEAKKMFVNDFDKKPSRIENKNREWRY